MRMLRGYVAAVQVAATCALHTASTVLRSDAIPCRSTDSPFQHRDFLRMFEQIGQGLWPHTYGGMPVYMGRYDQPPKYADRPGERSPRRIKVGCDATDPHGHMCNFFAGTLMRAVFPSTDIEIIPGPSNRSQEADIAFIAQHNAADDVCMPERRYQEDLAPFNHTPGWNNGVLWPPNGKVRLHKKKRPFCVCQEYEASVPNFVPGQCDAHIAPFHNYLFVDEHSQGPVIYMPESYRDFGMRWLNTPLDATFDRTVHDDATASQPLSTICKTSRLTKDKFMAFMHGTCWKDHYSTADFWLRIALFDELAEHYKAPDALAECRGRPASKGPPDSWESVAQKMIEYNLSLQSRRDIRRFHPATWADEAVLAWEPFRFAVVFQNSHEAGGVSEKIVHAWLARSVPVYFGPSDALVDHNPDSFINCGFTNLDSNLDTIWKLQKELERKMESEGRVVGEFVGGRQYAEESPEFESIVKLTRDMFVGDFQECVKKIREVDEDEKAWLRMVHTPVLKDNSLEGSVFDMHTYAQRLREVLRATGSGLSP
mmetsp:Transcript_28009/g.73337  ORF Transcript_28009/g.73337 Transcript_28009/m.73337 type:complete len:540 (+) Transcript_28009:70-1689(+)